MFWEQRVQFASISDIGFRRKNNQDSCAVHVCDSLEEWERRGHLFVVADGMGGHAVGELASKIATDTLPHSFFKVEGRRTPVALKRAIELANATIYERGTHNQDFEQMGTTCTALVLGPRGAIIGHVGDSRCYRIRAGKIEQLSFDHSLQWELIRQGHLTPEEVYASQPRNVITRSLGPEEFVQVDVEGPHPVESGDIYVLCSDGLTGHVQDHEIGMIANTLPAGDACRLLVNLANLRGGSDNITVVVCQVGEIPAGITPTPPPADEEEDEHDNGLTWSWLLGGWLLGMGFVGGLTMALFGKPTFGYPISGVSVVAFMYFLYRWLQYRKTIPPKELVGHVGEPYRNAPAELTKEMLDHMISIEAELTATARNETWPIDWEKEEAAAQEGKKAEAQRQFPRSFRYFAKAIAILMQGIVQHRKKVNRDAKWKKKSEPVIDQTSVFDD